MTWDRLFGFASQPGVYRLALHGKHSEYALMHTRQRRVLHEQVERFQAECELAEGHRALVAQTALLEPLQVLRSS